MNGESSIDVRRLIDVTGTNTAGAGEPSCTVFTGTAPPQTLIPRRVSRGKDRRNLLNTALAKINCNTLIIGCNY